MSTATASQIETRVSELIAEIADIDGEVRGDSSLAALDVDSLALVEIGQALEDEYEVLIEGEDMKDLSTVSDVVDLVARRAA